MGIEIPHEYGGSEASFTTAIIAIEELAKVDPSISVMADVHVNLSLIWPDIPEYSNQYSRSAVWLQGIEGQISSSISDGETGLILLIRTCLWLRRICISI